MMLIIPVHSKACLNVTISNLLRKEIKKMFDKEDEVCIININKGVATEVAALFLFHRKVHL